MNLNIEVTEDLVKTAIDTIKQELIKTKEPIKCFNGRYGDGKDAFNSYDIQTNKFNIYFSNSENGYDTIRIFILVDNNQHEIQSIKSNKIDTKIFVPLYNELNALNEITIKSNKQDELIVIKTKALSILGIV